MKPVTVIETTAFRRDVDDWLNTVEREAFIDYIARHPDAGVLIEGTGGARKVRWARQGGGKSGGVRVIYYFYTADAPLFLLALYGKSEKANLSAAEKQAIQNVVTVLRNRIRLARPVMGDAE